MGGACGVALTNNMPRTVSSLLIGSGTTVPELESNYTKHHYTLLYYYPMIGSGTMVPELESIWSAVNKLLIGSSIFGLYRFY